MEISGWGLESIGQKALSPLLLCAISLGPGGCSRRDREIRIGAVATLSGDAASLGHANRLGYEMALEEWNARGGVLGKTLRLVLEDDHGDGALGVAAVHKLIQQDKVPAILGGTLTRACQAGAFAAQDAGVPMVSPSATGSRLTETGNFIFRVCFSDEVQASAGAAFAFQELKARKAACLFDGDDLSAAGLTQGFGTAFRRMGGELQRSEVRSASARDFKAPLARILQGKPDLIYLPGCYSEAAAAARQARELGFTGILMGSDGWDSPRLVQLGGQNLEPGYFTCHFSREDPRPETQEFVRKFRTRFGDVPDSQAASAYDAAQVLLDAIRRAGTTDGPALRTALAATQLQSVTGMIRFDAQRTPAKPVAILELKEGRQIHRALTGS